MDDRLVTLNIHFTSQVDCLDLPHTNSTAFNPCISPICEHWILCYIAENEVVDLGLCRHHRSGHHCALQCAGPPDAFLQTLSGHACRYGCHLRDWLLVPCLIRV